jgi:DNA-directed RNA polymerase sigma subunit (sigma70/sigma32)
MVGAQMDAAIDAEAAAVRDAELLVTAASDYERTQLLLRRELHRAATETEIAEKLEWTVDRTRYVAQVVAEARRRHDEELLAFIDPEAIDFDGEPPELDA